MLMIAHLVQWAITGSTVSPVEPSESMEAVKNGVVNAGAIFFGVTLLATLVLGRWFCGWACHLVMLQDLCGWFMRRIGIRPKPFRSRLLIYVPFILALYMFVWPAVYRWGLAPLSVKLHEVIPFVPALALAPAWPGFRVEATTQDFWQTFAGVLVAIPFLGICGFATVYFLGNKGFCTYGCPYGGFFAPLDQYALGRIRVTDACEHCGHCTAVCSSNVRVHEEVREYGMVVDPGCMKCLDCVSVCPNDALHFGFGRPAVSRGKPRHARPKRTFDLTLAEEIGIGLLFLLSFLAVRGIYGRIPMLMAVGVALCVAFMSWKLWRLRRDASVNLHRFRLKYKGVVTRSGVVYAMLAGLVLLFVAHSAALRTVIIIAGRADARVTIPVRAVLAASPMAMPAEMEVSADRAIRWYRLARWIGEGGIGLLGTPEVGNRLAWLYACKHDFAEAERLKRRHLDLYGPNESVARDIVRLMGIQLREREAIAFARSVWEREPRFVLLLDDVILWHRDDIDTAIALCREGIARVEDREDETLYLLRRLSLLLVERGAPDDLDEAIEVFERTIEIDDGNPNSFVQLAGAHLRRGDTDAAYDAMLRAIELSPGDATNLERMVELLELAGRDMEADDYRARAAELRRADAPPAG